MLKSCSSGDIYSSVYVLSVYVYNLLIIFLYHIFHYCLNVDYIISSGEPVWTQWIPPYPPNPLPPPPADSLFPRVQVKHQVYSILVTTLLTLLSPRILTLKVFTTLNISSKSKPEEFVLTRSFESQEP